MVHRQAERHFYGGKRTLDGVACKVLRSTVASEQLLEEQKWSSCAPNPVVRTKRYPARPPLLH